MRIITINVNGIRSARKKGFFDWILSQDADFICIQETRAQIGQLDDIFFPDDFHCFYNDSEKKGYSGTAIFCKNEPSETIFKVGWDPCDSQARLTQVNFKNLIVISMYVPSGSSSDEALKNKLFFHKKIFPYFKELLIQNKEIVICADWNTCHKEIDLKNWKANQKNSGFLPVERAWLDSLYKDLGLIDGFRLLNDKHDQYTWWSNRGNAYLNNVGWRLDYHVISPGLKKYAKNVHIYKDERFSDHAPVIMDFDFHVK